MQNISTALFISSLLFFWQCYPSKTSENTKDIANISQTDSPVVGAAQLDAYLPMIQDKRIALVVNHTSMIGNTHLVDTLLSRGIQIQKIFAPEHGFRGTADAGENINNSVDTKTSLPLVSLYGKNKKPTPEQLADVDVVIFDIQDVGARFYTYISTMHYVMEACGENQKKCIILDRPNPNGDYFDGPVLNMSLKSFVGMHPIPIAHGLTVGELAQMINEEGWLNNSMECDLSIVKIQNYTHQTKYSVPLRPSPNLPNDQSIRLYPSICLFEGTAISVGRGTEIPFQVIGYPDASMGEYTFTPQSIVGMATKPLYQGQTCYGLDLQLVESEKKLDLKYLIDFYQKFPNKSIFFNNYFDQLAGNTTLKQQIKDGLSEQEIRNTWKTDLENYAILRKKYLLYNE